MEGLLPGLANYTGVPALMREVVDSGALGIASRKGFIATPGHSRGVVPRLGGFHVRPSLARGNTKSASSYEPSLLVAALAAGESDVGVAVHVREARPGPGGPLFTVWAPMSLATLMLYPLVRRERTSRVWEPAQTQRPWLFLLLAAMAFSRGRF
jgi:hypothetical protein